MKKRVFQTITGRALDLERLDAKEREFLAAVQAKYEKNPAWSAFASWWPKELQRSGLSAESVAYRICQDLEARLGIAQGKVAAPDYRDYLADLIDERHGSRYRFCKATGIGSGAPESDPCGSFGAIAPDPPENSRAARCGSRHRA